ncbi:MAG: helix-turn-helix domain-containing protein [Trebonia sp.]
MKTVRAYRLALGLRPRDGAACRSHAGASRFAWNWGLARCTERYEAERKWHGAAELHKLWNVEKKADPAPACFRTSAPRFTDYRATSAAEPRFTNIIRPHRQAASR